VQSAAPAPDITTMIELYRVHGHRKAVRMNRIE